MCTPACEKNAEKKNETTVILQHTRSDFVKRSKTEFYDSGRAMKYL